MNIIRKRYLCCLFASYATFASAPALAEDTATIPVRTWGYGVLSCVALSPGGTWFLTGSGDNRIRMFDTAGALLRTFEPAPSNFSRIVLSADGKTAVSAGSYNGEATAWVWDVGSGKCVRTLAGHAGPVTDLAFSFDGTKLLTGSYDSTARLWDMASGTTIRTFKGHRGPVMLVAFSHDGTKMATCGSSDTVKYWDIGRDTALRTLTDRQLVGDIRALAFDCRDSNLFVGKGWTNVFIWNCAADTVRANYFSSSISTDLINFMTISPDCACLLAAPNIWNLQPNQYGSMEWSSRVLAASGDVRGAAFLPDSRKILAGWNGNPVMLDAATGNTIRSFQGNTLSISAIAYSRDGTKVLCAHYSSKLRMLDIATGTLVRTFNENTWTVNTISFSRDGSKMVVAGSRVYLWDYPSGTGSTEFPGEKADISPDGSKILVRISGSLVDTIRMFNSASEAPMYSINSPKYVNAICFSSDGSRFLTASSTDTTIRIWNAQDGSLLKMFRHPHGYLLCAAFSPAGNYVASGSRDSILAVWDIAAGTQKLVINEGASVENLDWSPDGSMIVSGLCPAKARLWDASTGKCLRTFQSAGQGIEYVRFSPDGSKIAAAGSSAALKIWDYRGNATPVKEAPGPGLTAGAGALVLATCRGRTLLLSGLAQRESGAGLRLYTLTGRLAAIFPIPRNATGQAAFRLAPELGAGMLSYRITGAGMGSRGICGMVYSGK
jgi:WD40 repeat protein